MRPPTMYRLPEPEVYPIDAADHIELRVHSVGQEGRSGRPWAWTELHNGVPLWSRTLDLTDTPTIDTLIRMAAHHDTHVIDHRTKIERSLLAIVKDLPALLERAQKNSGFSEAKQNAENATIDPEAAFLRFVRFVSAPKNQEKNLEHPIDAWPEPCRTLILQGMQAIEVPPDFIALPLLASLSTAIGRRVQLWLTDDWQERAIFWLVLIAKAGGGKTPGQKAGMAGFRDIHRRRMRRYAELHEKYLLDLDAWEATPRRDRTDPRPVEPTRRHLLTTDSTIEAVGALSDRNNGVLNYRDEVVGFVRSMDAYRGKGDDREKWLSLWSGEMIQTDRMSRSLYVENPHLCLLGGIQPSKLTRLNEEAEQDGFLDRFLWAWPPEGPRDPNEQSLPAEIRQRAAELMEALARPDHLSEGVDLDPAFYDPHRRDDPVDYLKFDADAAVLWLAWRRANEQLRWRHEGPLQTAYKKFDYHVARLAIVFHCVKYPHRPRFGAAVLITRDTLTAALRLAEWFRVQANRVFNRFELVGRASVSPEDRVLMAVRQFAGEWVSTTELRRSLYNNVDNVAGILTALKLRGLVDYRLVEASSRDEPRGRHRHEWRISEREQNAQNAGLPDCLDIDALLAQLDGRPEDI